MKDIKEERMQQILNKVYEASSLLLEKKEADGSLQGNGHHIAQAIQGEVAKLIAPLVKYDTWLSEPRQQSIPISPQELDMMTLRSTSYWGKMLDAIRDTLLEHKYGGQRVVPSVRINSLYADVAVKACEAAGWVATHETDTDTQYRRLVFHGAMCEQPHDYQQIRFSNPATPRVWRCTKCNHRTNKSPDE